MKTKRKILLMFALLIAISALPLSAQDFKLFYAKNVTDVTAFRNLAELDKQLNWREVSNGAIDGNLDDVRQVKDMLAETRMKGLEDQQLFWRMRDEMLLCFRIDDTSNTGGSFRVEVVYGQDEDGKDIKKTLTTRKYFFANMPLACDEISINVWRVKDPTQRINFRYWVYDWDDDNVYIFQLDQKRQATGDTYKMEYVTSYMDLKGDIHSQSNVLAQRLADYHSTFEVAPGVMADGQHTISEDIADLGGFEIAFQTYTDHLTSHGFYGDELRRQQRLFFQAYAHIWRARYTDAYAQERVTGDIHFLPRERVNALVPHTDAWYDLFNVKPGDNLYIAPENRVHIW